MILEPVQGEGGVIPAPDVWMRRMRRITESRSIPLIADEIQTGVGRTGTFWAVEHSGVTPDVMVLSKAIGGSLPLAVVVYRDDLDVWEPGAHAGTFRGNQLAMAAGTATLAYVREHGLAERAATLGTRMLAQLQRLAAEFPIIGEVRGRGLMIGVELVEPDAEHGARGRSGLRRRRPVHRSGGLPGPGRRRAASRRARTGRRRTAGVPAPGPDRRTRRTSGERRPPAAAADHQRRTGRRGTRPTGRRRGGGGTRPHRLRPPARHPRRASGVARSNARP